MISKHTLFFLIRCIFFLAALLFPAQRGESDVKTEKEPKKGERIKGAWRKECKRLRSRTSVFKPTAEIPSDMQVLQMRITQMCFTMINAHQQPTRNPILHTRWLQPPLAICG